MSKAMLVKELKSQNQDFEFYPTTREIIEAMYWDMLGKKVGEETYRANGRKFSMLDIGAGECKVYNTIKEIAEEQPLLNEVCRTKEREYLRNEDERFANRVFITKYMAIEKSQILIDRMPGNVFVVGTDFHESTLIDKQCDIVFCNPPYSEYVQWATKIIREANAKTIYLVIPQRWGKNKSIAQALKDRKAKVKIIGNFDFLNAEDRKARAYVSLVKVELNRYKFRGGNRYKDDGSFVDPFDLWFNDTFKINADKVIEDDWVNRNKEKEKWQEDVQNQVVKGSGLVPVLVELYNKELDHLIANYQKLGELDASLFKELNVDLKKLLNSFKEKIRGLKYKYWEELFDNLSEITTRLTRKSRDKIRGTLMANSSIDFTESNIRAVVIWVIKNANHYYEEQMLELYDTFTTNEGIKFYKSNQHFVKDDFRYNSNDKKPSKYALDYRIILYRYADEWDRRNHRLSERAFQDIQDVMVIAKNLGFEVNDDFMMMGRYNTPFYYGEKENIYFRKKSSDILKKGTKTLQGKIEEVFVYTSTPLENGEKTMVKKGITYVYDPEVESEKIQYKINGEYYHPSRVLTEKDIFTTVKPYKNGNVHFQFNKKFMQKFNLEVGRVRGWLKDPAHAAEEMDIDIEDAKEWWKSSYTLLPEHLKNILPSPKEDVQIKKDSAETKPSNETKVVAYDEDQLETFKNGTLF